MSARRGTPHRVVRCGCEDRKLEIEAGHCSRCGHATPDGMITEVLERTGSRVSASTARTALAIARIIAR